MALTVSKCSASTSRLPGPKGDPTGATTKWSLIESLFCPPNCIANPKMRPIQQAQTPGCC